MAKEKAKFIKVDTTQPGAELVKAAHELAKRVYDLAPWNDYYEAQILCIQFADGSQRFASVMGNLGTHFAVALYPDYAAFERMRNIIPGDKCDCRDAFCSTNQLMLSFEKRADLNRGEREWLKASGVKFPKGVNPSFTSFISGFMRDVMGAREMEETLRFLRVFCDFVESHKPSDVREVMASNDLVMTWREGADGSWQLSEDEYSWLIPIAASVDPDIMDKILNLPVAKGQAFAIGAFPFGCGMTPQGRGKFARLLLFRNEQNGMLLGTKIINGSDDRETDWTPIINGILEMLVNGGYMPERIVTPSVYVAGVLGGICKTESLGCTVKRAPCEALCEAFSFITYGH